MINFFTLWNICLTRCRSPLFLRSRRTSSSLTWEPSEKRRFPISKVDNLERFYKNCARNTTLLTLTPILLLPSRAPSCFTILCSEKYRSRFNVSLFHLHIHTNRLLVLPAQAQSKGTLADLISQSDVRAQRRLQQVTVAQRNYEIEDEDEMESRRRQLQRANAFDKVIDDSVSNIALEGMKKEYEKLMETLQCTTSTTSTSNCTSGKNSGTNGE